MHTLFELPLRSVWRRKATFLVISASDPHRMLRDGREEQPSRPFQPLKASFQLVSGAHLSRRQWCELRSGVATCHADAVVIGGSRSPLIKLRMPTNTGQGSASSAIWKTAWRACRTNRVPVFTIRSHSDVSDHISVASGVARVRRKLARLWAKACNWSRTALACSWIEVWNA